MTTTDFGAFAVATSAMVIVLGIIRSATANVLMIYRPGATGREADEMITGAMTVAVGAGVGASVLMLAVGAVLGGPVGTALASLAIAVPVIAAQDVDRHTSLAQRDPARACRSDIAWFVGMVVALMALRRTDTMSLSLAVIGAHLAAGFGLLATGVGVPRLDLGSARRWIRERWLMATKLIGDFVLALSYGVVPLVLFTAVNEDLTEAGSLRAAQAMMGPIMVLFAASSLYVQPILADPDVNPQKVRQYPIVQSAGNAIAAGIWTTACWLIPDFIGTRVFGLSWSGARESLVFIGLAFIGIGLSTGPLTALRARGKLSENLLAQLCTLLAVLASIVLLTTTGTSGVLMGFGVGNLVASMVPWIFHARQLREVQYRPQLA